MNVNPSSEDFTRVVPWDSLTDEQKQSGDWIQLPDTSQARKATLMDRFSATFPKAEPFDVGREMRRQRQEHYDRMSRVDAARPPIAGGES